MAGLAAVDAAVGVVTHRYAWMSRFLSGDMTAEHFVGQFLPAYLRDDTRLTMREFLVLDELFATADMYTESDELLADPSGLYASLDELRMTTERTLAALDAFSQEEDEAGRRAAFASAVLSEMDAFQAGSSPLDGFTHRMREWVECSDAQLLEVGPFLELQWVAESLATPGGSDSVAPEVMLAELRPTLQDVVNTLGAP